ncbi:NAD(P)/FAD-dependent oxidoreductase [Streptomyces sp. NPDC047070]|uniref:flavin monoamine oxidase family protein n=1 Tax=Streptomyces sp. NPDC047070 TaxID=3154923 RepID=UPI0034556D52
MNDIETEVVVVGAGPAGLTAAQDLLAAGHEVFVLEARDRVGGRTHSDVVDGTLLEIGGQWISPDQEALIDLLGILGLRTFPRFRDGDSIYVGEDGKTRRYSGESLPVAEPTLLEIQRLTALLDELAAQCDPDDPGAHPLARELDTVTFDEWLRARCDDAEARSVTGLFLAGGMFGKPAHSFSALSAVHMAASAGSFSNLVDENDVLDKRVVGGMVQVSVRLAERLGDRVLLNTPVHTVEWSDTGVVAVADGTTVRARRAVIAVPPHLYSCVRFRPALPSRLMQAAQHVSIGQVLKVQAVYERPFWREHGLAGTCFSTSMLVQEIYDNTGYGDGNGVLCAFISDEKADTVLDLDETSRRERILQDFAACFGPEAARPLTFHISDWEADEWTRGAYGTSFDIGGLSRYGRDRTTAVGPLHWACADIAGLGYIHVDGAVRQGQRAAAEIREALAAQK